MRFRVGVMLGDIFEPRGLMLRCPLWRLRDVVSLDPEFEVATLLTHRSAALHVGPVPDT